jgi:hypothetical protein
LTGAGGCAGRGIAAEVAGRAVEAVARGLGPGGGEHATTAISTITSAAPTFPAGSRTTERRKPFTRPEL